MIMFKVCYDKGGGKKSIGARFGPGVIERAFRQWGWRGAEDGTPHPRLLWLPTIASLSGYRKRIESVVNIFAKNEKFEPFIALSGDNSCSFETVRAVAQHFPYIALAVFDAHPDACDLNRDPHANWVRRLWDEEIVAPEKTVFFGIRDPEETEMLHIKKKKAIVIMASDIYSSLSLFAGGNIDSNISLWQPLHAHALVIIVDIDVLDPTYAPGTGVLRSGGLNVRDVLRMIRGLCALPFAVKIGEICEVIPEEGNSIRPQFDKRPDPCGLTVLAAEAILHEMIRSISV